jgi:hypothetical protein
MKYKPSMDFIKDFLMPISKIMFISITTGELGRRK